MRGVSIWAQDLGRVMGCVDGSIPWRVPADLKHFRERTRGGTVVMGRGMRGLVTRGGGW